MFDSYQALPGRHDELTADDGSLRPHWEYFTQAISALGPQQLAERQGEMRRLLIEHGISYNIYGGEQTRARPWPMDLLPLLVTSREWRDVEVGITQRAELLRHILHDVYGPQRLIRRGLIPAEVVFGDAGLLLPAAGTLPNLQHSLIVYAADLGRSADGRLWVTADRTQAPSGMGYALAARTISSRVLPSIFRESNVHPVLPFLRTLRSSLIRLAEDELDRIAVLTAGPANETFSEHAYLARQLGLPLVEGADLVVAGGGAWMLDAEGRQPISVLLRRMDDDFCDPLELNRASLLGAPGLLQVVRNRKLICANPIGSGVLENPALLPFLPRLCRELIGEELKLPSRDTWWCGREADLWYVSNHFDELVIRGPTRDAAPIAVRLLDKAKRAALLDRIRAKPSRYVAQALVAQATVPVLGAQGASGNPYEVRAFAVATGDGFQVMSGGLARAGQSPDSWRFSSQLGGLSKDVWVLASEPQRDAHTLPEFLPRLQRPHRLGNPHVAENLIWTGRYAQRGEHLARMLRAGFDTLNEQLPGVPDTEARRLLQAITWQSTVYPGFIGPMGEPELEHPEPVLDQTLNGDDSGSLRQTVSALVATAAPVLDMLPPEVRAQLNRLPALFGPDAGGGRQISENLHLALAAINGLMLRALPEDSARTLIETGYAIEMALCNLRTLRSFLPDDEFDIQLGSMQALALTNTLPRIEMSAELGDLAALLQTLLLTERNPQSVRHQLMLLERQLRSLPVRDGEDSLAAAVSSGLSRLGTLDVRRMARLQRDELDAELSQLDEWLRTCAARLVDRFTPRRPAPPTQLVQTV